MSSDKRGPYYNREGYQDPTAYNAIKTITAEEQAALEEKQRVTRLMYCINAILDLAGFTLEERIVVTDKQTGKTYR